MLIHKGMAIRLALILIVVTIGLTVSCAASKQHQPTQDGTAPQAVAYSGEQSFQNRCSVCHGQHAEGTQSGPPLVNRLYEIGHHSNFSFHNAVNKGVTSHHWNFGDMPPIPNLDSAEVDAIICHVRDLQRAAGIAAGEPC